MRACFFDIECSDLKANFGVIFCGGIMPVDGEVESYYKGRKGANDKALCKQIAERLRQFDIIITYYGLGFDMPMLNSRLMKWGLPPVENIFHIDMYRLAKRCVNTHSRRIAVIAEFFGIDCAALGKTPVEPEVWMSAGLGNNNEALMKIVNHNKGCVRVMAPVLEKLKWVMRSISKA